MAGLLQSSRVGDSRGSASVRLTRSQPRRRTSCSPPDRRRWLRVRRLGLATLSLRCFTRLGQRSAQAFPARLGIFRWLPDQVRMRRTVQRDRLSRISPTGRRNHDDANPSARLLGSFGGSWGGLAGRRPSAGGAFQDDAQKGSDRCPARGHAEAAGKKPGSTASSPASGKSPRRTPQPPARWPTSWACRSTP